MTPRRWPLMLALALIWLAATLFLRADLGQSSDDYAYDRRDPVTGVDRLPFGGLKPRYFYRPLYFYTVPTLETGLGGHPAALHVISAGVHGLVAGLLFWLLRRAGCGLTAAGLATGLFLSCPAPWEVPFWPAAIPTGLAAAGYLAMCLVYMRYVQGSPFAVLALVLIAFAIPCFNEQPATGLPAMALLTPLARARAAPGSRARAAAGLFVAGYAVLVYLIMYWASAPHDHRGASGSFMTIALLPAKWTRTLHQMRLFLLLRNGFGDGAWMQGLTELGRAPVAAGTVVAGLAAAVALCFRRAGGHEHPVEPAPARVPFQLALFGVCIFGLGWLPVLALRAQGVEPRLCYFPALGLAFVAAGALELVLRPGGKWPRRALRVAAASMAAAAVLAGTIMMIGIQGALHARWLRDQDEAAQLRALIPNPPPGAILVPLLAASRGVVTGHDLFDDYFCGPLERPWSAPYYIRRAFARTDLDAAWRDRLWGRPLVIGAEERGIRYDDHLVHHFDQLGDNLPRDEYGVKLITWDRALPFLIEYDGKVRLIASFTMQEEPGVLREFRVPQIVAQNPPVEATIGIAFDPTQRGGYTVTPPAVSGAAPASPPPR